MPGQLRRLVRHLSVLVATGGLLAAACTADDPAAEPTTTMPEYAWGEEAELWMDGFNEVIRSRGGGQFARVLDPEGTLDFRSMDPAASYFSMSRTRAVNMFASILPAETDANTPEGWTLINSDGFVYFNLLDWGPSGFDDFVPMTRQPAHVGNIMVDFGPNGAERMVSALSVQSLRDRGSEPTVITGAEDVAAGWMAAWDGGEPGADPTLYSVGATIIDPIGGASSTATTAPPADWQISRIDDEPAIYPLSFSLNEFDGALFVVETADSQYCPNRLGIVVDVEDGLIVREERYWLASEARRCVDESELPADGWWVGRDLSFEAEHRMVEDLETVTGTVTVDGHEIELKNSTPNLDIAVEWAFGRFAEAGLEPPRVTEVTFSDYAEFCTDIQGRAIWEGDTWELFFCFGEDELCCDDSDEFRAGAMRTVLHELSHAWMHQNLDGDTRDAFRRSLGLDSWADPVTPWELQAREHAAETMSWGLLDSNLRMINIGSPSTDVLTVGFRLLTGVDPLPKDLE